MIYAYYAKPDGALVDWVYSRLQGPLERDGAVTSRLKVSSHQLHATKTSNTLPRTISRKPGPQATHSAQSQAMCMPDGRTRDARVPWGGIGAVTRRLKGIFHQLHAR